MNRKMKGKHFVLSEKNQREEDMKTRMVLEGGGVRSGAEGERVCCSF